MTARRRIPQGGIREARVRQELSETRKAAGGCPRGPQRHSRISILKMLPQYHAGGATGGESEPHTQGLFLLLHPHERGFAGSHFDRSTLDRCILFLMRPSERATSYTLRPDFTESNSSRKEKRFAETFAFSDQRRIHSKRSSRGSFSME